MFTSHAAGAAALNRWHTGIVSRTLTAAGAARCSTHDHGRSPRVAFARLRGECAAGCGLGARPTSRLASFTASPAVDGSGPCWRVVVAAGVDRSEAEHDVKGVALHGHGARDSNGEEAFLP